MRKLIRLLVAVAMVMSLATAVFATEPATDAGDHVITAEADIPATITLAAGETANYSIEGDAAWAVFGKQVQLSSDKAGLLWIVPGMWSQELADWNSYTVSDYLNGHPMMGPITFAVENNGTETATYALTVLAEPGTIGNPEPLDVEYGNYPYMSDAHAGEYYYTYTAGTEGAEVLKVNDVALTYDVMNMDNVNFNIIITRDDNEEVSLWIDGDYADEIVMPLAPGQSASVMVRAQELEATYSPPSVEFSAEVMPVTEISLIGDYTVESDEVWYAVNGMLAGCTMVVDGEDASITIDGTVVNAEEGVASVVLAGEGPVMVVKVANATDMIILPAPIEISAAGDYTVPGAEVTYAINSMLAGYTIVVDGENAVIDMNGTVVNAVGGVASAILNGDGPVIPVTVYNGTDMIILPPDPIAVNAAGDYECNGAEVVYAVNSMLAGYTIVVDGENAVIDMDGTIINAEDGIAVAVLNGNGPVIRVVVYNGTDMIILPPDPIAINATGDYTVDVAAGAEVELAVNAMLAGAILTVEGEGAYVYVDGTKYEAVNGVAVADLTGSGPVFAVKIGNESDVAAQYALNVSYAPISIAAPGEYDVEGAGEYAINAMLNGYILTVQGENAVVEIDGTEFEAVNGVVEAILNANGPTIKVVVSGAEKMTVTPAPIEIDAAGDYTVEGDEVVYAINSMLNGYIIVVQGENAVLEIDGTVIKADGGVASAVLNANGPVIKVKVTNADDMIILPAPTEIAAAGKYNATVAGGAEVEYAINGKLAGAMLTVKGEGAYIYVNGTKHIAVDGVATAVLDGAGAVIAVKIGNEGAESAQYELEIAYLPTAINAAGDYKVALAAGAEVAYVLNSKLDGYVITVKGEGAYLIIDGQKVEGKNGVVSASLTAKAATISVIVGNAGTAAAEWTMNIAAADNADTGDFGIVAAAIALAVSAVSGTALIAKKKEN